ncbi:hypothetical protein Q4I28_001472 [Leishmania naiffi]|uniref:Uncharacterized protein n=1 Tax=Leishmania naiffi TaxID=5678 RepID=A0AAW3C4W7_9TRYP
MRTNTRVSLMPTTASGVLCKCSPIAAAIAVTSTEADMVALAGVVRGQRPAMRLSAWAAERYGNGASPGAALATVAAEGTRESTAEVTLQTTAANRSSLASSGQPGPLQSIVEVPRQDQRGSHLLSVTSTELSGVLGGGTCSSLPGPSDVSAVSVIAPSVAATHVTSSYRLRKNISWHCTLCGYHVLAMDQDGTPLPFTISAFGNVLPMTCPRCKLNHTSWQPSTPFSENGDHRNLPTALSNRYVIQAPDQQSLRVKDREEMGAADQSDAGVKAASSLAAGGHLAQTEASVGRLATQQRSIPAISAVSSAQRRAYYCGRCGRRLLRVDANGELVEMDRGKDGQVLPITCSGCKENHSDWVVKPYAVNR